MNKCCKKKLADLAKWELKITNIENDLRKVVKYLYDIERHDWEEKGNPEDHIFHSFNNVKNYLVGRKKWDK